jgi:PAS domain S-box-containing protein
MDDQQWPRAGGETGALVRTFDWSKTSLGPASSWPQSRKTTLDIVLRSPVPMVTLWGADGVMIYNDGYATFAGGRHPRLLGSKVLEGWPEVAEFNRVVMDVGMRGDTLSFKDQHLVLYRSGVAENVWLDLVYSPILDEQGQPAGVLATVVETTERVLAEQRQRRAEEDLRQLNETLTAEREAVKHANRRLVAETDLLRGLFEQAPSFMAVLRGPEHVFELANAPFVRLIGQRDVVGKTVRDALPEVAGQGLFELLDTVYRTGEPFVGRQMKLVLQTDSAGLEERFVDFVYQPIRGLDGNVSGIFFEGSDVTDRAVAAERLRIAQSAGGVGTFEWFPETGKVVVSDEYRRIWGIAPQTEITADLLVSLLDPEDRPLSGPARLARENPLEYAEYRITRPDTGEVRWIARRGEVVRTAERTPRRFVGVAFDITQRKQIEEQLRDTNERLSALFNQTAVGIGQTDLDGTIVLANDRFCEILGRGREDVLGRHVIDLTHPDDRARSAQMFATLLESAAPFFIEKRYLRPDGSSVWVSNYVSLAKPVQGAPRYVSRIVVDITERRHAEEALRELNETLEQRVAEEVSERSRTEEALRQSQKMEAVGQLTGGIAHDFNNLLQGIIGSLELTRKLIDLGRTGEVDRYLNSAVTSATRAAALTHRLLAFSRRQPLDPKPVKANQVVASMEDLLRRSLSAAIEMELVLAGGLWVTRCDHNQLENAILNLVINARDAMPDGGKLTIETCNAHLDSADAAHQRDITPGQYVCISVTDTGTGMTPDVIARAFDPFFTTKPTGQGTGLGLSMIYGFARQSEGCVKIDSELGRGTTVKLYLPRYRGTAAEEEVPMERTDAHQSADGEVVLVVEDDHIVRALIVEVLRELGCGTLEASDGASALELLQSERRVDLLVTDIGLPGLNGRQVADAARERRPDLRVLFMTGYAENAAAASGFLEPGMQLITKPFAMAAIAVRVREMLSAASRVPH